MRQWLVIRNLMIGSAALAMAGCGGGGTSPTKIVAQVNLTPAALSMVAGEVVVVTSAALNSTGSAVAPAPNITINTSDPKLVTVSPRQEVCAGVWDSAFIVCNGLDALGNPLSGTASLTASANGVSSSPVTVSVHPPVTAIFVTPDPVPGCISNKATVQFIGTACSSAVLPHATTGLCAPGAADITSKVGNIGWISTNGTVLSLDTNGLATAAAPGIAGVVAAVGTTSSPATSFKTCMPKTIVLHEVADVAPNPPTETANMNVKDTRILQADMVDENGTATVAGAPVAIVTTDPEIVSLTGNTTSLTITALSPGGASIIAACVPPACGAGINQPVYSNPYTVTVNGDSTAANIYVGSSTSTTLLPFDATKTPPAAGTALTLPGNLLSMVFTPTGAVAYLATDGGLASLATTTNTLTTLTTTVVGKILAISPDGNTVILSNQSFTPDVTKQRVFVFTASAGAVATFILPGAVAAAFTSDSNKAYIAGGASAPNNLYVYSPTATLQKLNVSGNALGAGVTASGPFAFIANTSGLQAVNVCDNSLQAVNAPTTTLPQIVRSFQNADVIVAMNSTGVDLDTLNIGTPPTGFCPTTVTYTKQFIDFGLGALTARKLLVAPSITSHIVVLPAGFSQVLTAVAGAGPSNIPLAAGGTEALDGGLTLDGNTLWVGAAGTNTLHRINLTTKADDLQLPLTGLKKADGTQAAPDVVGVQPK